jgi:hypothetical protein
MAQGLVGGIASLVVLYAAYGLFLARLQLPMGLSAVDLVFLPGSLSWFIVLAGGILGFIGSFISLWRFASK